MLFIFHGIVCVCAEAAEESSPTVIPDPYTYPKRNTDSGGKAIQNQCVSLRAKRQGTSKTFSLARWNHVIHQPRGLNPGSPPLIWCLLRDRGA